MKIRYRLLILLLAIALVPLLLSMIFYGVSTVRLSQKLADDTRAQLRKNAFNLLHTLVDEYSQIFKRDEAQLLLSLQLQAREVEHRLAESSVSSSPLYFSADYGQAGRQPSDLELSTRHFRPAADGRLEAIPVSYTQQVVFLAAGVKHQDVAVDLQRLASMPEVYRLARNIRPDLFLWQYTALESGVHTSFPGKGGYPAEYDPRQREWYRAAKAAQKPVSRVITDLSTRTLILTLSMPVYRPDQTFAGVTAIDVVYRWLFDDWKVPLPWQDVAQTMVLSLDETADDPAHRVEIVYHSQQQSRRHSWQLPVEKQYLQCDDPLQFEQIISDLQAGIPNIRLLSYQGRQTLWAYGAREAGFPFPLVILPYETVVQQANMAEATVRSQVKAAITLGTVFLFVVVLSVSALAFSRSQTISLPIQQLAAAARKLSEGDFDAKVHIETADELQDLGEAFNAMGTNLREREKMMQSLALAREIQQHLLPSKAPQLAGFEILGRSLYCDETGGDYYDYIEFENCASPRMGIVVADVSGHGIGSALLMTAARGILRTLAAEPENSLDQVLCGLNRRLTRDTRDDAFMTFFYAVLDSETRSCHWISAGHAPIFFYRHSTGQLTELSSSGIPLGILEQTSFHVSPPLRMADGDILLIGTDGIWETENLAGEQFGTRRLGALIKQHCLASVDDIYREVMHELTLFRGEAAQTDDITLVVVKAAQTDFLGPEYCG